MKWISCPPVLGLFGFFRWRARGENWPVEVEEEFSVMALGSILDLALHLDPPSLQKLPLVVSLNSVSPVQRAAQLAQ